MRVALTTAWNDEYNEMAMLVAPNMHAYCVDNGYTFLPFKNKFHLSEERDPSLLTFGDRIKIQIFKDHYRAFDLIVWMDCDIVITNPEITLESIIGDRPFLWTYNPAGPSSSFVMMRTLPDVHMTLHAVQHRAAELRSHHHPGGESDQETMRSFLAVPPYDKIVGNLVSCKEAGHCMPFATYGWSPDYDYLGNWEPGDFLFTAPSLPLPERIAALREKLELVYGT